MMDSLRLFLYAFTSLAAYGLIHDQVTASVAVGWGWFPGVLMGVVYGVGLLAAARLGSRPQRDAASLLKAILFVVALTAGAALLSGILGFMLAKSGPLKMKADVAGDIPPARQAAHIACGMAHLAAWYVACVAGGIQVAIVWVVRRRGVRPSRGLQTKASQSAT